MYLYPFPNPIFGYSHLFQFLSFPVPVPRGYQNYNYIIRLALCFYRNYRIGLSFSLLPWEKYHFGIYVVIKFIKSRENLYTTMSFILSKIRVYLSVYSCLAVSLWCFISYVFLIWLITILTFLLPLLLGYFISLYFLADYM